MMPDAVYSLPPCCGYDMVPILASTNGIKLSCVCWFNGHNHISLKNRRRYDSLFQLSAQCVWTEYWIPRAYNLMKLL